MAVLDVRDLAFAYKEKQVLNGVDFEVRPGEIFCVFGTNGCGKTTMLNTILGLNKMKTGTVAIAGQNAAELSAGEKARLVAHVAQKSGKTFPYTVLEIVLMGRTCYSGMFSSPGKEDVKIAEEALRHMGMLSFRDRMFNQLSGGEAQLVRIARAIAQDTDLIIFDEPTSHLDFRHELNVIKYMMKIVRERGVSILMATHAPNHAFFFEAHGLPTRVALMEDGVFGAVGTPSEVLTKENMAKVFRVVTKDFSNDEGGMMHRIVMPVDFCEGGEWHEG